MTRPTAAEVECKYCECDDGWDGDAGTICLCDCHDDIPDYDLCDYCGRPGHSMYTCAMALRDRYGF